MTYQLLDVRELSNPLENLRGKRKSDNNQFVDAVFVFFIHFGGFTFFFGSRHSCDESETRTRPSTIWPRLTCNLATNWLAIKRIPKQTQQVIG